MLAVQVFFATLFNAAVAERIAGILIGGEPAAAAQRAEGPRTKPRAAPKPARSDALTLLAALQREARFVDFVQESLAGYSDAQIGAAARDVHRDCAAVLDRLFALRSVLTDEEGADGRAQRIRPRAVSADGERCRRAAAACPEAPVARQQVVLTVPASFDASARELTREAALAAGLPRDLVLLEEPQAAVYAWLVATGDRWRRMLGGGEFPQSYEADFALYVESRFAS